MQHHSRVVVALVAGSLARGKRVSSVFDYANSRSVSFSGEVTERRVSVYDYSRGCYISGTPTNLFDYGDSSYLNFKMRERNFNGFDYKTASHFSGRVTGGSVSLFDYSVSKHFNFSV